MLVVIISNKNFKFLSNMWQFFFERLNIVLLTSTTYYSQIDEIFEKTNQIVEIVIRFFIINYSNINFVLTLSIFQIQMNNFVNVIIDLSTNEINYEFKIRETLSSLIIEKKIVDLFAQRLKYHRETINIIIFINIKTKIYYDVWHVSLMFKTNDYVYLRLHHDYQLLDRFNKKISQQRCDFFFVKRRVDWLIYELNFSFVWRVYLVISITQLKLVLFDENLYQRARFNYFEIVEIKNDTLEYQFFEIEKLIIKRIRKYNRIYVIQYLIRWLNYESKYDEWKSLSTFNNNLKLVKQYEITHSKKMIFRQRDKKTTR